MSDPRLTPSKRYAKWGCCRVVYNEVGLPKYDSNRALLDTPYMCPTCGGPISGVKPNVGLRLALQERADELSRTVVRLEQWWQALAPARKEIEHLLPSFSWTVLANLLRPGTSMRQWVVAAAPVHMWPDISERTVPPLVILEWKVRLQTPDLNLRRRPRRKSKSEQLNLATQVYRGTLRFLKTAVSNVSPFTKEDYRHYMALPAMELARNPAGCNLHLLALAVLRMNYETYFSIFHDAPEKTNLDASRVDFPYGNEFAERVRICWRAQFIAEYASLYWLLVAARKGHKGVSKLGRTAGFLCSNDVIHDDIHGDLVMGKVAFPAVDGLPLGLFR